MAVAGKYSFVYCGGVGLGSGWFIVEQDGTFKCGDIANSTCSGTAREEADGWIALELEMTIPAGTRLVQGTAAQDLPYSRNFRGRLPPLFGDGYPRQITFGPGEVTIMVKRVPDDSELQLISAHLWKAALKPE